MSDHIPVTQLALYLRGDIGFWSRKRVERHVSRCEECARIGMEFAGVQENLARAADRMPPGLDPEAWQTLASEMTANIRLGLSAGECVDYSVAPPTVQIVAGPAFLSRPRLSLALAGFAVLVVLLALEHPAWHTTAQPAAEAGVLPSGDLQTLEASGDAVMVRSGDRGLSVAAPAGSNVIRTVSDRGAVRSRYVDDTGVTIVNVYAQ